MKLTLKELQTTMQEQIDSMKTQIQKSKREEYELHERADRHLLNLDAFRKETDFNFREVRTEAAELRSEIAELRSEMRAGFAEMRAEMAEMRAEIRAEMAELRANIAEMRANIAVLLTYATNIDVNHEARIAALEAKNPN